MAEAKYDPFHPDFDHDVRETLDKWHIPGIAFSVVHGEETWSKGYGHAYDDVPFTSDTLYFGASTTKAQLCACWAIYIASEANQRKPCHERISWSTPLADIIGDDFVLEDAAITRLVTLEDAVSHRTGMAAHDLCYGPGGAESLREITRAMRYLPLHNPFRTQLKYCNTMYMTASYALEVVSGQVLADFLREKLHGPLSMMNTYGGCSEAMKAIEQRGTVFAKSHSWSTLPGIPAEKDGHLICEGWMTELDVASGAGYIVSTVDDYAKWMRCLLTGSEPLSPSMVEELWKPRSIVVPDDPQRVTDRAVFDGDMHTYALGWFVGTYRGHKVYSHPGGIIGGGSQVFLIPDKMFGVTFFGNGENLCSKVRHLAFDLFDDLLGIPKQERYAKQQINDSMMELFWTLAERSSKAQQLLYPGSPLKPSIPLSLPLHLYAGTYKNLGYGTLEFTVGEGTDGETLLRCAAARCWNSNWTLRHVNAESWHVTRAMANMAMKDDVKARSWVDADGTVSGFEIAMETTMPDTMLWFARV